MEPLHFRAPFWTSWHYDITGFLYWSSVYWNYETMEGAWERPAFRDRFWGEGLLLYPGPPAGIQGPVTSIRLKLAREALEDYEYMTMAAALPGQGRLITYMGPENMIMERLPDAGAQVDGLVADVASSFQDWSRNPADYERARERMAQMIVRGR